MLLVGEMCRNWECFPLKDYVYGQLVLAINPDVSYSVFTWFVIVQVRTDNYSTL